MAVDLLNATMLLNHNLRAVNGDRNVGKFHPLRSYPGHPFEPQTSKTLLDAGAVMGGYRRMSPRGVVEWLKSRGLPAPAV